MTLREFDFLAWIQSKSNFDPSAVPVGPGDDCAVVACGGERILITTDQVLDGVHFLLAEHGPQAAGRKAMARNLSDIAAVAGEPMAAEATVALPKGFDRSDAEAIYAGMRQLADKFDCPIVGGDVGSWAGPLAITVTIFGRPAGDVEPVLRSGARAGDAVCVTGRLGGAWRSRRHLEFTPRIAEAIHLASNYPLRSMIDVSDGLAMDLDHICQASGMAAEIVADEVPIHPDVRRQAADDASALQAALGDGEDYELLFSLPVDQAKKLCEDQPLPIEVTRIGCIAAGQGLTLVHGDGRRERLEPCGWEHET